MYAIDSTVTTSSTTQPDIVLVDQSGTARTVPGSVLSGPFVRAPDTNASGQTSLSVTIGGLTAGKKVRVRVIGVFTPISPGSMDFLEGSQFLYQLPPTLPANRGVELSFP